MNPNFEILLLFAVSLLLISLGLYLWLRRPPEPRKLPPKPLIKPEKQATISLRLDESAPYTEGGISKQNASWRKQMLAAGRIMQKAGVQQIYFLHGTFVGSDPFNVLPPLMNLMPQMAGQRQKLFEAVMKKAIDRIAGDVGNFLPAYIQLYAEALGGSIPCETIAWSSTNHHWGRLQGAIRLIEELNLRFPQDSPNRVLLIGHSHARQVFALFTHLIAESELAQQLWTIIDSEGLGTTDLMSRAQRLSRSGYDFVTLGGPLRYPFAPTSALRFLHIINHRGATEEAEHLLGFWRSTGGDYVQQWGTAGSDTIATTSRERQINRKLDACLGKGIDTRTWVHSVAAKQRVGDLGRTLLVDFRDQARFKPNGLTTIFGHGIYTRFRVMLFLTKQICLYHYDGNIEKK